MNLNSLSLPELYATLKSTGLIRRLLELARDEDLAIPGGFGGFFGPLSGDITSTVCPFDTKDRRAHLRSRAPGVIAGLAAIPDILAILAPDCRFAPAKHDGSDTHPGDSLGEFAGPIRQILTAERPLLNLLARMSGIATRTRQFLTAMGGDIPGITTAKLYDTRKTTPGLRIIEKYAVRCGGGYCHRLGLFDAVLIKDNHIAHLTPEQLPAFIRQASLAARQQSGGVQGRPSFIEVEVDSLLQLDALMTLEPGIVDIILLDNMGPQALRQAVAIRNRKGSKPELEASGGITLETIEELAATGIDRISVGSLTHSAPALDLGLDML